ncbi:MAG: hypothetical protein AAF702_36000 [Chloroflexota bacterium]
MDAYTFYQKHHIHKADERFDMFSLLYKRLSIERVLYPGCFVHVTPSFVFPVATYVDMEQRAKRFFAAPGLSSLIASHKIYQQEAVVHFHHQDYREPLPEADEAFDLLISQYGGFVSQSCKRYLKIGGWLLTNNSHGDASMASLDRDYKLVALLHRRDETFRYSTEKLDEYFIPKKDISLTKEYLKKIQRGIAYQKSVFAYLFERV